MTGCYLLLIFSLSIFPAYSANQKPGNNPENHNLPAFNKDSIEKQILYNGRVWRNFYFRVKGNQFLFSDQYLHGSVTIEGVRFNNLLLQYDIYKDELLIPSDHGFILQLNKEKIDKFTVDFQDRTYLFEKFTNDTLPEISGYVNILYSGKTSLLVRYRKELLFLAFDNLYDVFNEVQKIFILKDGRIYPVNRRKDFINLLTDHKQEIRSFIKANKLEITRKIPDSFIHVLEYYDKLNGRM